LFHINKPYAGQLFVSFFGAFFDEIPLKFVAFLPDDLQEISKSEGLLVSKPFGPVENSEP
jgi:hypothetical protein